MNKEKTYNGNLNINERIVSLETDINYQGIEIDYVGSINIESLLSSDYIINYGRNKIIILKTIKSDFISLDLFRYRGMALITSCKLYTDNFNSYNLYVNKSALQLWQRLDTNWENLTDNWEDIEFDGNNNKKNYIDRRTIYDEETRTYTTTREVRKK